MSEFVHTDRHKMGTPRTLTYSKLMKEISPQVVAGHAKVTVVGCGQVGMAAAFSMLTMGVCSDLALCDMRKDAAIGEKMDLLHGLAFLGRRVWIEADSDYIVSKVRSHGDDGVLSYQISWHVLCGAFVRLIHLMPLYKNTALSGVLPYYKFAACDVLYQ